MMQSKIKEYKLDIHEPIKD